MTTKRPTRKRRVLTGYTAQDRERLIREQAQSGETKAGFCRKRGINLGTFHGWSKHKSAAGRAPSFAEVEVAERGATHTEAAVEVLLPNGARIGIRNVGKRDELVALIRGVAGC